MQGRSVRICARQGEGTQKRRGREQERELAGSMVANRDPKLQVFFEKGVLKVLFLEEKDGI